LTLTNEAIAIQSLFHIQNKDGNKVPFNIQGAQPFIDEADNPNGRVRLIIAKARQKKCSSLMLGKFAIRCLGKEGTHAVVISHESSATQRLLDRVDYYFKYINGPAPDYGLNSRKEMSFPRRDSTYYIGTAGSRTFGRGDWITDLHCSEYAWWEQPEKHMAGLFQAVPYSGRIYLESTGNGRNNDFFYIWGHADDMGYKKLFISWFIDDEYTLKVNSWKPDCPHYNPYLLDLQHQFNLSDQHMAWYELKLKEFREDLKLMQQEYPSTPEECFQATGGSIFTDVKLSINPNWQSFNYNGYYVYKLIDHPKLNFHYIIGGDPSGGTGHDDAGLQIFCVETGELVFELFYNTINPIQFGSILCDLGKSYNTAFLVCESNNHGAAVIPYLKENYPRDRIYKRKFATAKTPAVYGWNNGDTTKHALVGLMLDNLDQITLYGIQTVKELKAFEETPEGKMQGKSDNLVIATGLAMLGLKKFDYLRQEYTRPKIEVVKEKPNYMTYTLESVLANIEERRKGIYGNQAGPSYPYN
jgi:hypothetical protein